MLATNQYRSDQDVDGIGKDEEEEEQVKQEPPEIEDDTDDESKHASASGLEAVRKAAGHSFSVYLD